MAFICTTRCKRSPALLLTPFVGEIHCHRACAGSWPPGEACWCCTSGSVGAARLGALLLPRGEADTSTSPPPATLRAVCKCAGELPQGYLLMTQAQVSYKRDTMMPAFKGLWFRASPGFYRLS